MRRSFCFVSRSYGLCLVGWTPLHYAAIHAPPTLVSYLATHGCSPLSKSSKGLTPLDIITGYDVIPGREDVAFVLEESMKASGWTGSARSQIRETRIRDEEAREIRRAQRRKGWAEIGRLLGLADQWWEGRRPGEGETPRMYLGTHDAEIAYQEEEEDAAGVENLEDLDEDENDPTGEYIDAILVGVNMGLVHSLTLALVAPDIRQRYFDLQPDQPPSNILCHHRSSKTRGLSIASANHACQCPLRLGTICSGQCK